MDDYEGFDHAQMQSVEARPVVRRVLEKHIQKQCVAWARSQGYLARKFSSPANRSAPDYLLFSRHRHLWVEFKAPGKQSTEAQREEQRLLLIAGLDGFQCDNFEKFKQQLQDSGKCAS